MLKSNCYHDESVSTIFPILDLCAGQRDIFARISRILTQNIQGPEIEHKTYEHDLVIFA